MVHESSIRMIQRYRENDHKSMTQCRRLFIVLALFSGPVFAQDASQCGFIQEANYRSLCRALVEKNASQCGFINDSDLRSMCRALAGNDKSQCGFITNNDQRAMCRALTANR